jgi:hypothetical protein
MTIRQPEDLSERCFKFACDIYLLQESNELVAIYVVTVRQLQAKLRP